MYSEYFTRRKGISIYIEGVTGFRALLSTAAIVISKPGLPAEPHRLVGLLLSVQPFYNNMSSCVEQIIDHLLHSPVQALVPVAFYAKGSGEGGWLQLHSHRPANGHILPNHFPS